MGRLMVVSNRVKLPGSLQAGGMAVGIEAAMAGHEGVWIGWSGDFATPDRPAVTERTAGEVAFATVDLPEDRFEGYYNGFSNQVLWPMLHGRADLAVVDANAFIDYVEINARIASLVAEKLRPDDLVWVHDYQLFPLAALLRAAGVRNRIGFFLHTPFADSERLARTPFAGRLARWLRAFDLVGLQTERDVAAVRAFLASAGAAGAGDDEPALMHDPIGIDTAAFAAAAESAEVTDPALSTALAALGTAPFAIAIDRIDYSKAIPERIDAFARFRGRRPAAEVGLLQVAVPSRTGIPAYRREDERIARAAAGLCGSRVRAGAPGGLHLLRGTFDRASLASAARRARVGLVTPWRDGMNLVAKEYVAAQDPADPGVLVLSPGAGAADELAAGALFADPGDPEAVADALERAFAMGLAERRRRWRDMMDVVTRNDAARWAGTFVDRLAALPVRPPAGSTARRRPAAVVRPAETERRTVPAAPEYA